MDINTVKTVYSVSFTQEEIRSIIYASIDSMRDEFPDLSYLINRSDTEIVFNVTEEHSYE